MKKNTRSAEKANGIVGGKAHTDAGAEPKAAAAQNSQPTRKSVSRFRVADFFVVLLCLSGAAASFNLFRLDLFRTVNSQNQQPVGTVTIKSNTVQRRHQDRVIWDRLFVGSHVYEGDVLRIAESSSMGFKRDEIEVEYIDYQIRRIPPLTADGILQVEGNLLITVGAAGGNLVVNGSLVEAGPGTVIKSESGENGTKLQVLAGERVRITKDGETRERNAGDVIGWDADGHERIEPSAVVLRPRPNARYLQNNAEPLDIGFVWVRKDIESGQALRLEIAADRNFTRLVHVSNNYNDAAQAALNAGFWYWRLSYGDTVLAGEHFTVIDAVAPVLVYPIMDSVLYYKDALPELCFQWSEIEAASSYLLDVCETPDFMNPRIRSQVTALSYNTSLGPGTWYWRVRSFFPPAYEGSAAYSPAASFRIEQGEKAGLVLPEPAEETPPEIPAVEEPPPLLPAPGNLRPSRGTRIGAGQLRTQRRIDFRWSAVAGANGYIFTLYQQTAGGRRQVIRSELGNRTSLTLDNLSILDRGTFVWQVEAVNSRRGVIEQRGRIAESSLVVDFPLPSVPTLQIEELQIEAETRYDD